jgi:hypothetical protein
MLFGAKHFNGETMITREELIEAWLTDLETTTAEQGQEYLARRRPDRDWQYCCLGRLCEVAMKLVPELGIQTSEQTQSDGTLVRYYGIDEDREELSIGCLPTKLAKFAGIGTHGDRSDDYTRNLVALNDNKKLPFRDIARVFKDNRDRYSYDWISEDEGPDPEMMTP